MNRDCLFDDILSNWREIHKTESGTAIEKPMRIFVASRMSGKVINMILVRHTNVAPNFELDGDVSSPYDRIHAMNNIGGCEPKDKTDQTNVLSLQTR